MRYSVLAVDDEPLTTAYLAQVIPSLCEAFGPVTQAANGVEALQLLASHSFDLILTDIRMPEVDGLMLAQRVYETNPEQKIVILSGFDEFSYAREAMRYGVREYLLKPIEKEKVREMLETIRGELEAQTRSTQLKRYQQENAQDYSLRVVEEYLEASAVGSNAQEKATVSLLKQREITLLGKSNEVLSFGYELPALLRRCRTLQEMDTLDYLLYQLLRDYARESNTKGLWFFGRRHYRLLSTAALQDQAQAGALQKELEQLAGQSSGVPVYAGISEKFATVEELRAAAAQADKRLEALQLALPPTLAPSEPPHHALLAAAQQKNEALLQKLLCSWLAPYSTDANHLRGAALCLLYPRNTALLEFAVSESVYAAAMDKVLPELSDAASAEIPALLLSWLNDLYPTNRQREQAPLNEPVERATRFIEAHYAEAISLTDVSDALRVTPNYLSAVFHSGTGETYIKYLTRVRMQHAAAMLCGTDLRIAEIAKACGYFSDKNFFHVFKRAYGVTPNEYRQQTEAAAASHK